MARYRLGATIGAREIADEQLEAEQWEFRHRRNRHFFALVGTMPEEHAFDEAVRRALDEMRRLQRHGGRWLTRRGPQRPPGRRPEHPRLLDEFLRLRATRPMLSVRSGAAILRRTLGLGASPRAVEEQLRRALKTSSETPGGKSGAD